jgi:hypothetical protein
MGAHHRAPSFHEPRQPVRTGAAGLRIATDGSDLPPREQYRNPIARSYAEQGYVKYAEVLEAGYGCSACHITHGLNRIPKDHELDLARFEKVAIAGRVARFVTELAAEATIGASTQIDVLLSQRLAERITTRNMIDPLDPITTRQVARLISSDPVASRSYQQLQQQGTEVILDFGLGPARLMGVANQMDNTVVVYARNHGTAKDVVSTIVHESSHIHRAARGARNTQLDEVRARSREFLYYHGRRPTLPERKNIWHEVEELFEYSDLPRR